MNYSYYVLVFLCSTLMTSLSAQIINGGFDDWHFVDGKEIPIHWETGFFTQDSRILYLKDTDAFSGPYAMKLLEGASDIHNDCKRYLFTTFPALDLELDFFTLSFAYKSISKNEFGLVDFRVYVDGKRLFYTRSEQEEYDVIEVKFLNTGQDSLTIQMTSGGVLSEGGGCPHKCITWVDDIKILEMTDQDGDGFIGAYDCDDTDPNINPSAIEIAGNEVDENCDGIACPFDSFVFAGTCINLYPNPAGDRVNILYDGELILQFKLYDSIGRIVKKFGDLRSLDIAEVNTGMYYLQLSSPDSDQKTTAPLMIKR